MKDTVNIGVIGISGRGSSQLRELLIYIRTEPKGAPR